MRVRLNVGAPDMREAGTAPPFPEAAPASGRVARPVPGQRVRTRATEPPVDPRLLRLHPAVPIALVGHAGLALVATAAFIAQATALSALVVRTFLDGVPASALTGWFVLLAGAITVRAAAGWADTVLGQRTAATVKTVLRRRATTGLLQRPSESAAASRGELTVLLTDALDALDGTFSGYLPALVAGLITPIGIVAWLVTVEAPSALVLALSLPLVPVFMALIGLVARSATRRRYRALAALSAQLLLSLRSATTIRLVGAVERVGAQVHDAGDRLRRLTLETLRIAFLSALVLELVSALGVATVAVIAGVRLAEGTGAQLEPVLVALLLAPDAFLPLRRLGAQFHANEDGAAVARRLLGLLDQNDEACPVDPVADREALAAGTIELKDVRVTHAGRPRPALDAVSLTFGPHGILAIVGQSGAGKSTLAALLTGLRGSDAGSVRIGSSRNGTTTGDSDAPSVAWVPQEPAALRGTVRELVSLGVPDVARPDDAAIQRALSAVGLADEIAQLPRGVDTPVGPGGRGLSRGQWRRIALARALLRPADLVVLDEPTGDLDVEAERAVRTALRDISRTRTVVVLTHRVALAHDADRVVLLEDGRIVTDPAALGRLLDAARPLPRTAPTHDTPRLPSELLPRRTSHVATTAGAPAGTPSAPASPTPTRTPGALRQLRDAGRSAWPAVAATALTPLAGVALVVLSGHLISRSALRPNLLDLTLVIVGVRGLSVLKALSRYVERLAGHDVALRAVVTLRDRAHRRLAPTAPISFGTIRTGEVLARLVADIERLQLGLVRGTLPVLGASVAGVGLLGLTALLLPAAVVPVLGALLLAGLIVPAMARLSARGPARRIAQMRGRYSAELLETLDAAPELHLLGRLDDARRRLDEADAELARADRSARARGGGADAAVQLVIGGLVVALTWIGMEAVADGRLAGVWLASLVTLAVASLEIVGPLPEAQRAAADAAAARTRLAVLLDPHPVTVSDRPTHSEERGDAAAPGTTLTLHGVCARYPGAQADALHGIDLVLGPGRRIGVIGPSGSGKSTLALCASGLLTPGTGRLLLDGVPTDVLDEATVRAAVTLATQQVDVLDGTLASNLRLAVPEADDRTLRSALDAVGLGPFLETLPEGLDTDVGERGARLSGGQRRRLALARTLLLRTPIIILDEPTADLDPEGGRTFLTDALALLQDRAVLLLTHDLRALPMLDEVVVLTDGAITARGTHASLLASDSSYAARWSLEHGPAAGPGVATTA